MNGKKTNREKSCWECNGNPPEIEDFDIAPFAGKRCAKCWIITFYKKDNEEKKILKGI